VIIAALLLGATGFTAADFFPLKEGRRATYEERGVTFAMTTDVVGAESEIGTEKGIQVITFQNNKPLNSTFYRVDPDAVMLLGYSKENPLPIPMPVFKIGPKRTTWEYLGANGSTKEAEGMLVTGESEIKAPKDVMGQKADILEVKITAKIGGGPAQETVEQKATYAKGIGLIELTSKTRVGKRSIESTLKLVKLENPGG
jgi:hypothetical protein